MCCSAFSPPLKGFSFYRPTRGATVLPKNHGKIASSITVARTSMTKHRRYPEEERYKATTCVGQRLLHVG